MSDFATRFLRSRSGMIGLVLLLLLIVMALLADILYPGDPWKMVDRPNIPPFSDGFLFGTDQLGRDVAAGVVHGARVSLMIGFASSIAALGVGVTVGAVAGYLSGWVDDLLMRLTEFFQAIPSFMLAIVLVAIFSPTLTSIVTAIAVVSWPPIARLVRAEFLTLRQRDFIRAAQVGGHSRANIILHQIFPTPCLR